MMDPVAGDELALRDYALAEMNRLLAALAAQVAKAAQTPDADAIHDVRVSIRRFTQTLLTFPDLFPTPAVEKIRKRLRRTMKLTSEIRNRDIAMEFLGDQPDPDLLEHLQKQRAAYEAEFSERVGKWTARDFSARWRAELTLDSQ